MKVLSLFNGCSLELLSLQRAGANIEIYAASEIDKFCNKVAKYRHPETIMLGDVTKMCGNGWVVDLVAHILSFMPEKFKK